MADDADADATATATATAVAIFLIKLKRLLPREEGEDLLCGLADEVRSLRDDLERIHQSFNGSFSQNRNWQARMVEEGLIHQIRDTAFEAEDIIDKYLAIVAQRRGKSIWDRAKDKISQLLARRSVEEEIKGLRTRLQEIYKRQERIGIEITQQGDLPMMEGDDFSLRRRRRRRRLLVEEIDLVGFDTDAKMIVERLTKGEARRDVIPIVGMGGIGKTTLAGKVYNDAVVAEYFDFRAWACVSPDFIVRDLLQAIMNRAMRLTSKDMEEMSVDELGFELRKYLSSTRYLIVLDDVWSSDLWGELAPVFPNNKYGSRIILTTRQDMVARRVSPSSPPHRLRFLNEDESWDLFSRKVFPEGKCPSDLEELGKQMVYKCGGLPLAIVVLAGFLKKKEKTGRCWSEVSSGVSSFLTEHTDHCSKILELSYMCLPHHLKPCFLYFGLFPKHFEIPAKRLVCLWIAEGFLQEEKDRETMEEVGEGYLEELIARNLVQISKRRFDGTVKTCCIDIHDLLQHFCLSKAKKEKFLEVLGDGRSSSSSSFLYNSRRLGLHSNVLKHICSNPSASKLHSVLFFSLDERQLTSQEWKSLWKGFPLLRVLDLWVVGVEIIPNEIGKLIHLRFLRLKSLTARTLPASICDLWSLETLEVAAPCIDRPQIDIWKMKKLRHLNFHGQAVLPEPPKEEKLNNVLSNLLTLSCICPTSCSESVFSNLPNLIKLGIRGDLEAHMNLAFKYLPRLNCLLTLKLERDRRCKELTSLRNGVKFPPNLTKLTLLETQLLEDPMDVLGQLPNLQVLNLKNSAYSGSDLNCPVNGFPKLQVLKLVNLAVRSWTISEGSMLSLKSVVINRCGQLHGLPPALPSVPAFRKLELWWPNVSLMKEAREIEMSRGKEQFKLVIYHP